MRFFAILCLLSSLAQASSWDSWSAPYPIRGAVVAGKGLWLATAGGMRWLDDKLGGAVFSARHGLEETSQIAVAMSVEGELYTLSDKGYFCWLNQKLGRFETISRSLVENADRPLEQGLLLRSGYAVIGFNHRIVVLDLSTRTAKITFTQMGDLRLTHRELSALQLRGDTLYVAGDTSVYKRMIPFDSLESDRRLADPSTWSLVASNPNGVGHFYFENNQIKVESRAGMSQIGPSGELDRVIPGNAGGIWINGDSLTDSVLFDTSGRSLPIWMGTVSADSSRWIISEKEIWAYRNGILTSVPHWNVYPNELTSTIDIMPGGEIVAWASPWQVRIQLDRSTQVRSFVQGSPFMDDSKGQAVAQPMKTMAYDGTGMVFTGTWGTALFAHDGLGTFYGNYHETVGSCIDSWMGGYPIIRGVTKSIGGEGVFLSYWGIDGVRNYGVGWIDASYTLYCADNVGSAVPSGPLQVYQDSHGNWTVFSAYSASVESATSGGIDILTFDGVSNGELHLLDKQALSTGLIGYPRDVEWSAHTNRLWLISASHIGYWESGMDSVETPFSVRGIGSVEYTAIEADIHGNLWVGTRNDGVYHVKLRNGRPDTLDASRITTRDGLLSMTVLDLAIDTLYGRIAIAHDLGVSLYYTVDVRSAAGYMQKGAHKVKVYPNPFRPGKHSHVLFEFLSEKATVTIFNSGGRPVRRFQEDALTGGRLEWDGKLENGSLAPPGVYQYAVRQGKNIERGRLLLIR